MKKRMHYLSNKELLKELLNCKYTYSEFLDDTYKESDVIIPSIEHITDDLILNIKTIRMNSTNEKNLKEIKLGKKNPISIEDIKVENLVFKVMTWDHVPKDIIKQSKTKFSIIKFPPFKHYAFIDNELKEVGRSHWKGGFGNGHFNYEEGKISNLMVNSLILLIKRYLQKPCFSTYSYKDDMFSEALAQLSKVLLQFDESRSLNVFAWYTTIIRNAFVKILKDEKKSRDLRDDLIHQTGQTGSFTSQYDDDNDEVSEFIDKSTIETTYKPKNKVPGYYKNEYGLWQQLAVNIDDKRFSSGELMNKQQYKQTQILAEMEEMEKSNK